MSVESDPHSVFGVKQGQKNKSNKAERKKQMSFLLAKYSTFCYNEFKNLCGSWIWWPVSVTSSLGWLNQWGCKYEGSCKYGLQSNTLSLYGN